MYHVFGSAVELRVLFVDNADRLETLLAVVERARGLAEQPHENVSIGGKSHTQTPTETSKRPEKLALRHVVGIARELHTRETRERCERSGLQLHSFDELLVCSIQDYRSRILLK